MNNRNYTLPILLVTSLFFLWGLAYGLLDVLNKHFQEAYRIANMQINRYETRLFMITEVNDDFSFGKKQQADFTNNEVQEWEELRWKYQ